MKAIKPMLLHNRFSLVNIKRLWTVTQIGSMYFKFELWWNFSVQQTFWRVEGCNWSCNWSCKARTPSLPAGVVEGYRNAFAPQWIKEHFLAPWKITSILNLPESCKLSAWEPLSHIKRQKFIVCISKTEKKSSELTGLCL